MSFPRSSPAIRRPASPMAMTHVGASRSRMVSASSPYSTPRSRPPTIRATASSEKTCRAAMVGKAVVARPSSTKRSVEPDAISRATRVSLPGSGTKVAARSTIRARSSSGDCWVSEETTASASATFVWLCCPRSPRASARSLVSVATKWTAPPSSPASSSSRKSKTSGTQVSCSPVALVSESLSLR